MDVESVREYCISRKGATEDMPFGEEVVVFRAGGKIFALLSLFATPSSVNLKCDPEKAMELRAQYDDVQPGYHMNKKHWNTILLEGDVPAKAIRALIDHSYELIVKGLSKAERERLQK